ncbi:class I SAM-dependent RNA methyltransferase [Phenylobacterium montanum]|uniref:Class I SAM-dependent RNA methyltransferase n=1 Tax=Phenylobacterium montanum TaxID=2823693 RepID=A0A975G3U4_9CAUL|nr:class I SAM-dependent RNA methyltransferase [Caulobacter sp. S6]QUD90635.1 class I SAM-dependent RNA methyltransferase [Caulobacter sp. S6]
MGAQGDGLAAGPVFAPLSLPGETIRARVSGDRAEIEAVLQASPDRVEPACRHFGHCGGCSLQHWADGPYLAWKVDHIRKTLARERIETDFAPAFEARPGTRRRLALHARREGGRVSIGFKARKSWRLVEIEACPVADPRLVAAFPALRRLAGAFFEHPKSAPTLHVTLSQTGLDIDVTGVERKSGGLSADARMRAAEAAREADMARVSLAGEVIYQERQPMVRVGPAIVALPPGSFLQAVAEAEAAMAAYAVQAVKGAGRIADLFCGVGAFTFRLAELAPVYAADSAAPAVRALSSATASAPGLKAITAEARDLSRRPFLASEMKKIDAVVFDPPRAGAMEQAREIAASKVPLVVGVSCNPATFARDARILIDAGFTLREVLPVDQFLWSPHVELVGVFSR